METNASDTKKIFNDRPRTNLLKKAEQVTISTLLPYIPKSFTPNTMTAIGFIGSLMVLLAFILARFVDSAFLWLAIAGLALNWVGDSLDGRLAYYRNIPRKWYGFSLDIIMDWLSIALIGAGSLIYASEQGQMLTYAVVIMYGWAMIITQLRYKITDSYQIDSGLMGPTEFRIILSMLIGATYFFPFIFETALAIAAIVLFFVNIAETNKLLNIADAVDKQKKRP